jgi:hypothetical protein
MSAVAVVKKQLSKKNATFDLILSGLGLATLLSLEPQ